MEPQAGQHRPLRTARMRAAEYFRTNIADIWFYGRAGENTSSILTEKIGNDKDEPQKEINLWFPWRGGIGFWRRNTETKKRPFRISPLMLGLLWNWQLVRLLCCYYRSVRAACVRRACVRRAETKGITYITTRAVWARSRHEKEIFLKSFSATPQRWRGTLQLPWCTLS